MAESNSAAAPALNTPIESHRFEEKEKPMQGDAPPPAKPKVEDDDEDEDIDALIEDLESQDGHVEEEEEGSFTSASNLFASTAAQLLTLPHRHHSRQCPCDPRGPAPDRHSHGSDGPGGPDSPSQVRSQPDEGREGEPRSQVRKLSPRHSSTGPNPVLTCPLSVHVLRRSHPVRHGGRCRPGCRS